MDSIRDISSRLRSLNGPEGNMSSALSLAQALLHHDPSAVALLPINPYNEDHMPILLLPSSVHIHYLKALLDWCVSQLVREPKPQKQNVHLSQSPLKMKITPETLPAASTPAYAGPGALKGSHALNSRMNPESWDLLSALLTGAWAGEAAAAAVPPSILSAAASALKHVSVETRPITSSKASGPPLEHSLLTQDQLLHAAVNQCLHILFKIPALINPVSEHSSLVPSQNSHALAVKQGAAAPASYLTNNPRFRPGLEPCIAFAAAVLDACPPKPHELALYETSVAGLSSSNGNSSHIQWLHWLDSVYISVQAVHSSVQGHPNTKRVFQAVTSRLMIHISAFIQPPMSHMTSQTLTTLPRDKAHDSSSLSGARYLGTSPATDHNSHLNTEIIEGLGGGSDTHTKLKLKYNDVVVAEAELGKAILELLELTVFSDVHVTGLAEACLLTSSKALKLQASGGVDASVAELEEKQGRQDDSKTGVFDVGPNTSKVQTVELKDKKMKKKKKVKLEVPAEADRADKDEEDASIAHQASVSAEKSQQEAVMPHQYILIQVVSEALERLSPQKNSNLDSAAAFQGNPLEQLNRQKMLLKQQQAAAGTLCILPWMLKQQQAAAGTLCILPWMLTTFCKAAGRHRKIAASDVLAAARASGRSHYHQSNVRGRQTNEGGPSTQHGPKNQGSQQGVASNSSKDLLPGAEFNMLQCLLGILLPLINIKIQDLVDSSLHEGDVRSNGVQDPLKRRNVEHSPAAQKPQGLRKRKRSENMKQQQKQGGSPGCAGMLLQQEVEGDEDAEELSSHKDVVRSHRVVGGLAVTTTAKMAMSGLGSLLAAVKGTSAYQPTRDLSGAQLSTLQLAMDTVMMCVTHRKPVENLCAATEGCVTSMSLWESSCVTISAILDLDHRTVQPHLQEVWHLLWLTAGAHEGCKSVQTMSTSESSHIAIADATTNIPTHIIVSPVLSSNRSPSMQSHLGHHNSPHSPPLPISHAAVSLVCKIVSAYRELRQLQYLLNSLNSSLLSIADELLKKEDVESAASPHRPSVHEHRSLAQRTAHMHTLCEGVLAVVRHQSFLKALEHAVRLLPSGQTVYMIKTVQACLETWASRSEQGRQIKELKQGDQSLSVLSVQHLGSLIIAASDVLNLTLISLRVDLTTAIPAAAATAALIQTPIAAMLKELLKKPSEWIPVHTDTGRGKAVTRALTGTSNLPHPDALGVELGGLSSQNKKRGTQAGRLKTAEAAPVVQPEAPAMIPKDELQDACDQVPLNPKWPSSVSVGALVLMLKMYCAGVRLHAQCAAMHPEILPLVDQGGASESEALHGNEPSVSEQPAVENSESLKDLARIRSGYFAPFQQWSSESHGGEGDLDLFLQVCETLQLSVLDPPSLSEFWGCSLSMVRELQEAFHTCMVQRLMMLSEQVQRLSAFCPKDEVIGTRSRVTQTRETAFADDKGVGSKTHDVPPGGGDGEGKDHKQEGRGVLRAALARKQSEGVQLTSFLLAPLLNASFTLYGDPPACPGRRSELIHFSHLPSHLPGTADTTLVAASAKREAMLHRALHSDHQIGSVLSNSEQIWISCMKTMPCWVRWASTYDLECILRIVVLQGSVEPFHWNAPTSEIMLLPEIQAAFPSAFTKLAFEISNKVLHCLDEELFDPQFMKALTGTMRQASCDPPALADSSSSSLHSNVDNEHSRDTMLLLRFHALEDLIATQMRTEYKSTSSLRVNEHDGNNGIGLHLDRRASSNKGQESKALMQATSRLSGLKRKVQGSHHDSAASQDISRLRTLIHTLNKLPLACMDVTSLQDLFCSLITLSVLCTALLPIVPALFSEEASKVEQLVSYESRNEILQTLSCSLNLCSDLQHLMTQRQAAGIMCQQIPASCLKHLLEWGCASSYFLNCLVLPTSLASTQPSRMLESSRRRGTRMELREADERARSLGTSTDEMDQQKDNFLMDGVCNAVEAYAALVSSAAAVALGSLQQLKTKKRVSGCDPLRKNYKDDRLCSSPASGPEDSGAIALGDDPNPVASEILHSASCLMSDIEGMFVTRVDAKGKLQTVMRGEIDDKGEEDEEAEDRGAMQSSKEAQVNIEPTVGLVGAAADHVTTVTTLRHHPQNLTLLNCHQLTYLSLYSKCCILSALTSQISVAVKTTANVSRRVVRGRNKEEGIAADDLIQNACPQSVEGILENIGGRALSLISIVNGHMPQSSTLTLSLKRQSLGCLLAIQGHAATPMLSHEMASQDTEQVMSQSLDAQEEGATVTRAMNHVPESQDVDEEDEADDHDLALSTASLPLHPQAPQQTSLASMHPSLEVAKAMLLQQFGKLTPLTKSTTPQLLYSRFLRIEADSRLTSRVCCFLATAKTLIPEPNNQQSHLSQLSSLLDLHLELLAELTPSEVHPVPQPGGAWSLLAADLLPDGHRRSIRMGILLSIRSLLLTSTRDQLLHLLRLMTVAITSDLQRSPWSTRGALGVVTQGSSNGESRGRGAGCGWKLPHLLCLLLVLEELPGPAPAAALAMHSAQMVSALTLLIPMLKWPGLQLHVASATCTSACICLCLRCLESISGRDTSFRLGPARVIGMVGAVAGLFPTTIKSLTVSTLHHAVPSGGLNDIGGMNWCGVLSASASLLASLTRHRAAVLQRSIPVVIQALKGMLVQLMLGSGQFSPGYAEGTNRLILSVSSTSHSISTPDIDQVLMRCCSEISRVYEGVSTMDKHKVSKYCLVMVSDYISVVDSKNSADSMEDKRVLGKGNDFPKTCGSPMAEWLPFKAAATLRRGVYALIATLSPAELQHLHKVLGTSGKGSDGGAKREILSILRAEHEKLFKFQGKI